MRLCAYACWCARWLFLYQVITWRLCVWNVNRMSSAERAVRLSDDPGLSDGDRVFWSVQSSHWRNENRSRRRTNDARRFVRFWPSCSVTYRSFSSYFCYTLACNIDESFIVWISKLFRIYSREISLTQWQQSVAVQSFWLCDVTSHLGWMVANTFTWHGLMKVMMIT